MVTHEVKDSWRHACGCMRTSDKLKQILKVFPEPPPPTPTRGFKSPVAQYYIDQSDALSRGSQSNKEVTVYRAAPALGPYPRDSVTRLKDKGEDFDKLDEEYRSKTWQVMSEVGHLLQFSVTATALGMYYFIYCYMQLLYYTLKSAVYFHQADGSMKITIAVVTISSLIIGFHVLSKIESWLGISLIFKIFKYD